MSTQTQPLEKHAVRANKLDLLERLADDLAHEIKNPLHSMVINLEVLKRRVARAAAADDPHDMMRYIGVLNGELERVTQRVELLLRLVRPGRGAETATPHDILEELMELLQLEGSHREVAVTYEPNLDVCRARVARDPARQIFLNVVLHVLDGLAPGGRLLVATRLCEDQVCVEIRGEPVAQGADAVPGARWAVARALAQSLGGSADCTAGANGVTAVLRLPTAPAF